MLAIFIAVVALILALTMLIIGLRHRQTVRCYPTRGGWRDARLGLSSGDRIRVEWATLRHRPVRPEGLIPAQRAYLAYTHEVATRSPLARKPWAFLLWVALEALVAGQNLVQGLTGQGVLHIVVAALFCLSAIMSLAAVLAFRREVSAYDLLRGQLANDRALLR